MACPLTRVVCLWGWVQVALANKVKLSDCIQHIKAARDKGLTIPVVLMGASRPHSSLAAVAKDWGTW